MNTPSPGGSEFEVRRLMAIVPGNDVDVDRGRAKAKLELSRGCSGLLDQYFALGGDLGQAEAHFYRAYAYVALRNLDAAADLKQGANALKRSARWIARALSVH